MIWVSVLGLDRFGGGVGGGVARLVGGAQGVPLPGCWCCGTRTKSTANGWGEESDGGRESGEMRRVDRFAECARRRPVEKTLKNRRVPFF